MNGMASRTPEWDVASLLISCKCAHQNQGESSDTEDQPGSQDPDRTALSGTRRTMNTYGHLFPGLLEEAADRLEASLFADGRQAVDAVLPGVGLEGLKPVSILAGPEGIEPPTRGLGVPCSIH